MKLTSLLVLLLPSLLFGIPETWNSSTTYQKNDVVLYTPSGASVAQNYIALQSGAGQQPDTSSSFWSSLDRLHLIQSSPGDLLHLNHHWIPLPEGQPSASTEQ